jgi:hypothetical protein
VWVLDGQQRWCVLMVQEGVLEAALLLGSTRTKMMMPTRRIVLMEGVCSRSGLTRLLVERHMDS